MSAALPLGLGIKDRFSRVLPSHWLVVLTLATVALALAYHLAYSKLDVDAGWYTYPAYALSLGADPNENQSVLEQVPQRDRLVILFNHFTKNNVRILPLTAWFTQFKPSIAVAKSYALLELGLLVLAFALCAARLALTRSVALCLSLLFVLDAVVINSGVNDLRPDLFVALLTLLALWFLHQFFTGQRWPQFAGALGACTLLALSHPTSVVSLAVLLCYAGVRGLQCPSAQRRSVLAAVLVLWCVAIAGFFLKGTLLNQLLSSEVDSHTNMLNRLEGMYGLSPIHLLKKEFGRWASYLFWNNPHLLLLYGLVALNLLRSVLQRNGRTQLLQERPLTVAVVIGLIALMVLDPHGATSHALTLSPLLLLSVAELDRSDTQSVSVAPFLRLLVLVGCAAMLFTTAMGYRYVDAGLREANVQLQQRLRQVLREQPGQKVVLGPAEIWPYLDVREPVLLLDRRSVSGDRLVTHARMADYVIVNESYRKLQFLDKLKMAEPAIEWQQVSSFKGNPSASVQVYRKHKPGS